jgi:hypothetical protein
VTDFSALYDVVRVLGPEASILREPIMARIGRSKSGGETARMLAEQLPRLPFAKGEPLTASERAILDDPARRRNAVGLITAAADREQLSLQQLVEIVREHGARLQKLREKPMRRHEYSDEYRPIETVRAILCRRGPEARGALQPLLKLQKDLPEHVVRTEEWQFMLARLGLAIDRLPTPSGKDRDQYLRRLRHDLDPNRNETSSGACY